MQKNDNNKLNNKKSNNFITKVLLSIILCFLSLIYIKSDNKNYDNYKKLFFDNTFSFSKSNNILNKYIDKKLLGVITEDNSLMVFNDNIEHSREKFENGIKFKYSNLTPVNSIESGIVVFIGEKEKLGNTIIIQGVDGYDIWYSNINNSNLKIYDYIETNVVIGDTTELIITISKDGNYINYDEYLEKI